MTLTNLETEPMACHRFDQAALSTGLFTLYREVPGQHIQPRAAQVADGGNRCRIDRILVPTVKLAQAGWAHGAIGVEVKSSEMVADGKALSQVLDYQRCVWTLPTAGQVRISLDWVFIFPMPKEHGPLASLMAHNRIGTANSNQWTVLHLQAGEHTVLRVDQDHTVTVGSAVRAGAKFGSR